MTSPRFVSHKLAGSIVIADGQFWRVLWQRLSSEFCRVM
jgi:hypothetical protein